MGGRKGSNKGNNNKEKEKKGKGGKEKMGKSTGDIIESSHRGKEGKEKMGKSTEYIIESSHRGKVQSTQSSYSAQRKYEIVFFDCETTESVALVEFAAIAICSRTLKILEKKDLLIKPNEKYLSCFKDRENQISKAQLENAEPFDQVKQDIYNILDGRTWAGHGISNSDIDLLKKAFGKNGMPRCMGIIDTVGLIDVLSQNRYGSMRMESIVNYFGHDKQTHRSLADVKQNIEVLKQCAAIHFVEKTFPDLFPKGSWTSPPTTRSSKSQQQ